MPQRARSVFAVAGLLATALAARAADTAGPAVPIRVIFDTDMAGDVDDVGALAVLHALADAGEVEILATMVSSRHAWTPGCLDAINTYYGRPDVPIGVVGPGGVEEDSKYARAVAEEFPHDLKGVKDAPEATALYRKILAGESDGGVVVVTVGYLTNLQRLLASKPDEQSPLEGAELVKRKVRLWVCMGGVFPRGREWNVHRDAPASIDAVGRWPTPILFSGYEIGQRIMTGEGLRDAPKESPVRRAYEKYNGLAPRQSWDQTAVLVAVRGPAGLWGVHSGGQIVVNRDGSNTWTDTPGARQSYLVEEVPPADLARRIEALMLRPPKHRAKAGG